MRSVPVVIAKTCTYQVITAVAAVLTLLWAKGGPTCLCLRPSVCACVPSILRCRLYNKHPLRLHNTVAIMPARLRARDLSLSLSSRARRNHSSQPFLAMVLLVFLPSFRPFPFAFFWGPLLFVGWLLDTPTPSQLMALFLSFVFCLFLCLFACFFLSFSLYFFLSFFLCLFVCFFLPSFFCFFLSFLRFFCFPIAQQLVVFFLQSIVDTSAPLHIKDTLCIIGGVAAPCGAFKFPGNSITELINGDCTTLTSLRIERSSYTNLDFLARIKSVSGNLYIKYNGQLENIDGLSRLTSVGGYLNILNNYQLQNVDGLRRLTSVDGNLRIDTNNPLQNIDALSGLEINR